MPNPELEAFRRSHWCNSHTPDGEPSSVRCTCSIGRDHHDDGDTYELGETLEED